MVRLPGKCAYTDGQLSLNFAFGLVINRCFRGATTYPFPVLILKSTRLNFLFNHFKSLLPQNVAGFTPMHRWYDLVRFRDVSVHCSVPICFATDIIMHLNYFIDLCPFFLKRHTCLVHLSVCISRQYPMLRIPAFVI